MKTTFLVSGLAVLTLAGAAGAASAQQPAAPAQAQAQTRMLRGDADRDGRISQAEFVGRRVERLTAADADRDGSVTREELRASAQAHRAEQASARFDRLDADRNGALSRAEFDAAHAGRGERGHRMRGQGGRRGHALHAGKAERGPIAIADVQARTEQVFTRLDADRDGFITRDERRAGMRQARERRVERRAAHQASPQTPVSE